MQIFGIGKPETPPPSGPAHGEKIKQRCEMWIGQLEPHLPVLEVYAITGLGGYYDPSARAEWQIERFKAIVAELDGKESDELKAANVRHLAEHAHLAPFGRDILAILETGKPVLPDSLNKVADFLEAEKRAREIERIQAEWARKAEREKQKILKQADEERREREELEDKTGLPRGTLEKLAASKTG